MGTSQAECVRFASLLSKFGRRTPRSLLEHIPTQETRHVHFVDLDQAKMDDYQRLVRYRESLILRHGITNGALSWKYFNEIRRSLSCTSFSEGDFAELPTLVKPEDAHLYHRASDDNTCSICLEIFDQPVGISCRHVFCLTCIRQHLTSGRGTCPLCRSTVDMRQLVLLDEPIDEYHVDLPKLNAILQLLLRQQGRVLVFSEFGSTIRMLRTLLNQARVQVYELSGHMSKAERQRQLSAFENAPNDTVVVFLMSVAVAGTGLNLQSAQSIVFCEPLVRSDLYDQAVGRIMRIGQQSATVHVHQFVTRHTLEEALHTTLIQQPSWTPSSRNIVAMLSQLQAV